MISALQASFLLVSFRGNMNFVNYTLYLSFFRQLFPLLDTLRFRDEMTSDQYIIRINQVYGLNLMIMLMLCMHTSYGVFYIVAPLCI